MIYKMEASYLTIYSLLDRSLRPLCAYRWKQIPLWLILKNIYQSNLGSPYGHKPDFICPFSLFWKRAWQNRFWYVKASLTNAFSENWTWAWQKRLKYTKTSLPNAISIYWNRAWQILFQYIENAFWQMGLSILKPSLINVVSKFWNHACSELQALSFI